MRNITHFLLSALAMFALAALPLMLIPGSVEMLAAKPNGLSILLFIWVVSFGCIGITLIGSSIGLYLTAN